MYRRSTTVLTSTLFLMLFTACGTQQRHARSTGSVKRTSVSLRDTVRLDDDTFSVLAKPIAASRNSLGQLAIADESDRDVKLYDNFGHRIRTIGHAGRHAGEFTHLNNAQFFGDTLIGYDFHTGTITIVSPVASTTARTIMVKSPPFSIRVVDDSLLLYVRHPGQRGPLLTLARLNGQQLVSFFDPQPFKSAPELRYLSGLFADAHAGVVFAGIFGDDTLYVFDYAGKRIAAAAIPSPVRLDRLEDKLASNGGRLRHADSTWFHDGINALMGLVALNNGDVALQIAAYDAHMGTDLLRAKSTLLVVHTNGRSAFTARDCGNGPGMLLGRDIDGAVLIGRQSNDAARGVSILRRHC